MLESVSKIANEVLAVLWIHTASLRYRIQIQLFISMRKQGAKSMRIHADSDSDPVRFCLH
jgi:hypothetical protein